MDQGRDGRQEEAPHQVDGTKSDTHHGSYDTNENACAHLPAHTRPVSSSNIFKFIVIYPTGNLVNDKCPKNSPDSVPVQKWPDELGEFFDNFFF